MSDDLDLKMFETKAELAEINEKMKEIRKQNNELKNEMTLKTLVETVSNVKSSVEVLQQTVTALSSRVFNYDDKLSELNQNLRKINEKLGKADTISSQHNEVSEKQNETTQVLDTNENSLDKQTILLLGGDNGNGEWNNLVMLDNNGQNWKQLKIKLPYTIRDHGAQFLNNNIYIFGGYRKGECLSSTCKLSKSLKWEKMADMNQKHGYISNSNVILNDQIWVCGGWNGSERLKSVEMYDPLTNKWKCMKEMNECRHQAAAAVVNGKIFCSGGVGRKSVECYDPSSDVWTTICDMPQKICGHRAVEMNGNFIFMGGCYYSTCFNDVWALDTTDKNAVWIEKPSMFIPRDGFSIAKIDDKIFVCGGNRFGITVEIFDGEVWRNGPNMPAPQRVAGAVVIPMEFARELE